MTIDKTKMFSIIMGILALSKIVYGFVTTGDVDFSQQEVIGEMIVIIIAIATTISHHEEVKIALNTPVPETPTE